MIRFKKIVITMVVILQTLTFSSCKSNETKYKGISNIGKTSVKNINKDASKNPKKNEKREYALSDYYPFKRDIKMTYKGTGNEYAGKEVFVDFIDGNKMQIRENNGGTEVAKILELKDGELRVIISKEEFYYRDNLIELLRNGKIDSSELQNDVILKEPIKVGTKWNSYKGKERKITGIDVKVDTPYGKLNALEVTTFDNGCTIKDYYAPNIGYIMSLYDSKDMRVTTSLMDIKENASLVQTIKFYYPKYYPESNSEGLVYKNQNISLKTNSKIKDVFQKYFREEHKDKNIVKIMSDNTKINYIYLEDDEKKVCIDFSKEFVSEMNAGTSKELLILQAVTNTLGDYYNVDKVYISLDGKPYESGHILLNKNESFRVKHINTEEIKEKDK